MTHLTDLQIQQFVFEQNESADDVKAHIQQCAACRSRVEEYRLLFAEVEKLPEASFDINLEALVMKQLPQPARKKKETVFGVGFMLVCLLAVLALGYLFGKELVVLFGGVEWLITAFIITTAICLLAFLGVDMCRTYLAKLKTLNME